MWITHLQLDGMYYEMCCKIENVTTKKYYVSSYIVLSCVIDYTIIYVQCPTYINKGAVLIKILTKLLQISTLTK